MANPLHHSMSSVKKYGGMVDDYIDIHSWFDESKSHSADPRHRALRHHSQGIFDCEDKFGKYLTNSDGKQIPVRFIGEQHVREDCGGRIPSWVDWMQEIEFKPWMNKSQSLSKEFQKDKRDATTN